MAAPTQYRPASPQVISETLDGEAVIINLDTGTYYSLDPVASRIWDLLRSGIDTGQTVADLATRYDAEEPVIADAVSAFANQLVGEQLLVAAARGPAPGVADEETLGPEPAERQPFQTPAFSRFTDIQDLLLLDPIHEVEDDGWPRT